MSQRKIQLWYLLIEANGTAFQNSTADTICIPDNALIADFQKAVKLKNANKIPAQVDSTDLKVFKNKAELCRAPIDEKSSLSDLDMNNRAREVGKKKKDALLVVVADSRSSLRSSSEATRSVQHQHLRGMFNLFQHRCTTNLMRSFLEEGDHAFIDMLSGMASNSLNFQLKHMFVEISRQMVDGYKTSPVVIEHEQTRGMCAYIFLFRRGGCVWIHMEFGYFNETDPAKKDLNLEKFIDRSENNPVLIQGIYVELESFLLQSTSTYKEDRIAYISEFNILDYNFWFIQYYFEYVHSASNDGQYHHYIPRFILRNFRLNTSNRDRINLFTNPRTKEKRTLHTEAEIAKSYGVFNMYQNNSNESDKMHVEQQLSVLEGRCANIIRKIVSSSTGIAFYEKEIANLKSFLFIMWYRHEQRRSCYTNFDFDMPEWTEVAEFIKLQGGNANDVWVNNIAHILDSDPETTRRILPSVKSNYMHCLSAMLCIWEVSTDDEFIITDGCFGCSIKDPCSGVYYNVYPIHPNIALVLYGNPENIAFPRSIIDGSLVPKPIVDQMAPQQMIYQKVKIPRHIVNIVNGNILHRCSLLITYMRDDCLMRYVSYYDDMKFKYFSDPQDFSWLKQDLLRRLRQVRRD